LERHHALLQVESELGKGSCFSCHFAQSAGF
jgi:signal transduction histidine kinase